MIMLYVILGLSAVLNCVLGFLLFRASKRMLQFDDILGLLEDDLVANSKYFEKLLNTPILQNSPEIIDAQKNMSIIKIRLDEFVNRIGEATSRPTPEKNEG